MTLAAERARIAFTRACALDVLVRKPGNVSLASPGHGMDAALFLASAKAAAVALCTPGARVGPRIEAAVQATWAVAGCNTNLGILLLCAPVALAFDLRPQATTLDALRATISHVLGDLDRADAAAAYRAIAQANPGGLGTAADQDVHDEPSIDLRAAMALAADRDSIAMQYRDGYSLVFDVGLAALGSAFRPAAAALPDDSPGPATVAAVQRAYLALLSAVPDSHITRKHGSEVANTVMRQAQGWHARALAGAGLDADPDFQAWDAALKADGTNPGTTADLLVVSIMLASLAGL
jgi:triphosphoribosyl-dephospho-CoA synthase